MPHDLMINSEPHSFGNQTDVGRAGGLPALRIHRLTSGDALVMTSDDAAANGLPLLGNLGIVGRGSSALVRASGLRVELIWRTRSEPCAAEAGRRCRVCFGAFRVGEPAVLCACEALFHEECDGVRVNCPGCGAPRQAEEA